MDRFGIQLNLEHVAQAREKWAMAYAKFASDMDYVMSRLLNEAAINRLSVEQVSRWSGLTPTRVRQLMRDNNLNPKQSKTLLAQTAAEALQENAALLGIEPWEMDLMSPLAYLPMGSELREQLAETKPDRCLANSDHGPFTSEGICHVCGRTIPEEERVSGNPEPDVVEAVEALQRLADACLETAPNKDAVYEDYALVHRLIGKATS